MRVINPITGFGGGSPAWSPTSLANLALWLDADDPATITESGGSVSIWADKSPSGFDAAAIANPSYVTAALNSRPVIRFSAGDHLEGTNPTQGATLRTVCAVWNRTGGGSRGSLIDLGDTSSTGKSFAVTREYGVRVQNGVRTWSGSVGTSHEITVTTATAASTASLNWHSNGTAAAVANTNAQSLDSDTQYRVGSAFNNLADYRLAGDIAEIIVTSDALSDSEREKVEGYLSHKWGIALYSGHPYESSPP